MLPTRQQMVSILAQMQNDPHMGGDAYFITKPQLLKICLMEGDLLANLPASIYDGQSDGKYVFMKSGLENQLGISKARAETIDRGVGEIER